jgi:hypothetical protein
MKTLSLIIILLFLQTDLAILQKRKTDIRRYRFSRQSRVIVFADTPGCKAPIKIISFQKPNNTQCLYNVVRDSTGKIVCIAKILYDDDIEGEFTYEHYFDEDGKTFAFDKGELIPSNKIKDHYVRAINSKYYGKKFNTIGQDSTLQDAYQKLNTADKKDFNFPNFKYTIYKNIDECLKGYNIKL